MLLLLITILSTCSVLRAEIEPSQNISSYQGWITIQRRLNPCSRFDRSWKEYREGFGNGENFWIGNQRLYQMSLMGNLKVRFTMWDKYNNERYAEYSSFSVGSEGDSYRLRISGYSGNAGDAMSYHNNMRFSTKDADRDRYYYRSCSTTQGGYGGWWFNSCLRANLNGWYMPPGFSNTNGIRWNYFTSGSLKKTEIKVMLRM